LCDSGEVVTTYDFIPLKQDFNKTGLLIHTEKKMYFVPKKNTTNFNQKGYLLKRTKFIPTRPFHKQRERRTQPRTYKQLVSKNKAWRR
jgi:hypothetical protein